ncbi:hypothetical protein WJ968_32700 [Achromobacter xylosoxidans]
MTQMTADQQTRYDDLVSRYVDLDDKEKAELDGLVKTVKEAKAKRKAAIEDIQKKLKAVEPAFTLKELFGDELQTILKAEGYGATSTARVGKAAKAAGGESGTRNVDKPIKSLDGSQKVCGLPTRPSSSKLKAASLPSSKARVSMLGSLMLAMTTRRPTSFASWPRQRVNSPTRPNSAKCPKTSSAVRLPSRMMPQSKLPRRMPKPLLPNLQHSTPKPSTEGFFAP